MTRAHCSLVALELAIALCSPAFAADERIREYASSAAITRLELAPDGTVGLQWASEPDARYDVHMSIENASLTASWIRVAQDVTARPDLFVLTAGAVRPRMYFQVVRADAPRVARGAWGMITLVFPPGVTLAAPPLVSDRRFDGVFGAQLGAMLSGSDEGPGGGADEISILDAGTTNWTKLYLDGKRRWLTADGQVYGEKLDPGQGFVLTRHAASPARAIFTGPVGNDGTSRCVLREGMNIIAFSEGRDVPIDQPFEHPASGEPAVSYDEDEADRIASLDPDGSWHRFLHVATGEWVDLKASHTATYVFQPGRAVYFERPPGAGPITVRF